MLIKTKEILVLFYNFFCSGKFTLFSWNSQNQQCVCGTNTNPLGSENTTVDTGIYDCLNAAEEDTTLQTFDSFYQYESTTVATKGDFVKMILKKH